MRKLGKSGENDMVCYLTQTISEYGSGRLWLLEASPMAGALHWAFVNHQNNFLAEIISES
jgi:hypothetical protein